MPRVLIIEDNPVNLELVLEILAPEGYEIQTAETAEQGLRLVALNPPALILMDLHLPGMTGYEATRALKADPATATIPVVALTAHAMAHEQVGAREAGCSALLTKPIDTPLFNATLLALLTAAPYAAPRRAGAERGTAAHRSGQGETRNAGTHLGRG